MQCLEASELMSWRLDGTLTSEQDQVLDAHLATCESCRVEWKLMQRACALFQAPEMALPPPMFAQKVMGRIQRHEARLAVVRGGMTIFLAIVILGAVCIVPLCSLPVSTVLNNPSVVSVFVGVIVRLFDISGTLWRAVGLMLRATLASPGWLVLLAYVALAGGVAFWWARLVTRPVALDVKRESGT
jgi:predicted anti-sigma-YlaC factor YlaD